MVRSIRGKLGRVLALQVEDNLSEGIRRLAEMPNLIVKSVRGALADTVNDLHTRELMEMDQVFDRPTPYVKRGLKKRYPSRDGVLNAGIYFEEWPAGHSPADIMKPHVFGGPRRMKGSERRLDIFSASKGGFTVMSPGYPRNQYGNIAGGRYTQMLNEVGALMDVAARGNRKRASSAENRMKRGFQFFVVRNEAGDPIGIAEKRGSRGVKMMLVFTSQPNYKKRFNYFEVAQRQIAYSLPLHFNRIIQRYMSRM
jgi:hypothetical protein